MTVVKARWYPAQVVLPNGAGWWSRVYVLLAEGGEHAGMHVWRTRPQGQDETADWHAPVNWEATTLPRRGVVTVALADGTTAKVTPGGECRCGSLGRWPGPTWASTSGVRS